MDYIKLCKELCYILRHHPEEYNLSLDSDGYVDINDLLISISKKRNKEITINDIYKAIEVSNKERLEINNNKIRALYGHSNNDVIKKAEVIPPDRLYHGTSHKVIELILNEGLKPMTRQFVHLSSNVEVARIVGLRRDDNPVILVIDSLKAYRDGIKFYKGNDDIWLSDYIEAKYINLMGEENEN